MKLKWLISTTALALLIAVAMIGLAGRDSIVAAQEVSSKIEGALLDKFSTDGTADFIISFTPQADLSAAYSMDWAARGEFVVNTLRGTADSSQANAKAILDAAGLKYQTFIAGNELYVWSGSEINASALAALPEVEFIRATRIHIIDDYVPTMTFSQISKPLDLLAANALTTTGSPNATVDWGIIDTKADLAWALGARGAGIKVANIDTGVQYNHPALVGQYACPGNPGDPSCWGDPSNVCGGTPCDWAGHGTHTMGTMVAKDDQAFPYIAGMAPDANWIACMGCDTPPNGCSDFALLTCGDWVLAPGGSSANRPDVVNNSWGSTGGDAWYLSKVQAWFAAGIFPAFSAGNSTGCSSLGSPGDYQESFGTTGHNISRIHQYAQGPSFFGDDPYTKPNITAPAVAICSTIPTDSWTCGYSGTSMASPHSAGAVAQLWSVCPDLKNQIYATFEQLQNFADPPDPADPYCGHPPDGEGTYEDGYGYLNVLNSTLDCLGLAVGTLEGHVYDQDGAPLADATVTAVPSTKGNSINAITDPEGFYSMDLPAGTYDVTASKVNYDAQTVNGVVIVVNETTTQDFTITFLGGWNQIPTPAGCPEFTRFDGELYNGLVYFLGGRLADNNTAGNIVSFDPVAETCADTGTLMPNPVSNYTIALVNNGTADLLCVLGGRPAAGGVTPDVQCYDPVANTASIVSSLPGELATHAPAALNVIDNKVIVFGGFQNLNTGIPYETAVTYEWDPVTNIWTQKGDLPVALGYIQSAVVDGKIYAFGGTIFDGVNINAQVFTELYDPAAGTWDDAAIPDLPTAGAEGRAFGFDTDSPYELAGKVVIAGGGQWPADTNAVFSYDVATETYNPDFPDLNTTRRDQAGFFVPGYPGKMWVFGGRSGTDAVIAPPEFFDVAHPKATIIVAPTTLDLTLHPDETGTLNFLIQNAGDAPLDWSLAEVPPATWLSESPAEGTILPAAESVITATFDAAGLAPDIYTTTLEITSNDPFNPVIDVATTLTVTEKLADLGVMKTASPVDLKVGEMITYTVVVSNAGPQAATGTILTDTLPIEAVEFVAASTGCTLVDANVVCDVGELGVDETATYTVTVLAIKDGIFGNVAVVASDITDPVPANNTATVDVTIHTGILSFLLPVIQRQ